MKFWSIILAVYFFNLSTITCSDAKAYTDCCGKTEIHLHSDSKHSHETKDTCPPMCTCHCCGGVTLVCELSYSFKASYASLEKSLHSENSISEVSHSIWQPPKI